MLKAGTAARRRSARWESPVEPEALRQAAESFLRELDRRLQLDDPTWVGHCKLLVASESGTGYASVTAAGESPRWAGTLAAATAAEMTIYVALYGWSDEKVARALDGMLAQTPLVSTPS